MAKRCTNKACGKEFTDEDNTDTACQYHPGGPIFHEGLKGWSCCPKRFSDFSDFLAYKGCTTGRHTDVKIVVAPAEPEPVQKPIPPPSVKAAAERSTAAKVPLAVTVTASLQAELEKQRQLREQAQGARVVALDQACTRNACKGRYQGPASDTEECVHHPQQPVFHEGMKYWSCCEKTRTHDFDEFMSIAGCARGLHRWWRPEEEATKLKECRYDWFQSETHVVITIFAKCIDPEHTTVTANSDALSVSLLYQSNLKFDLDLHLTGPIVPAESTVSLVSVKMEIKLKKADASAWSQLSTTA
eukprot:m.69538 g.69538  ORF g.69538 m.69538 type:complete len:301 (+) comp12839_c0_seq2:1023-1925(+)